LHAAAASGDADIVEILLAEGLSADTANLYGELPIHRAAQRNQLAMMQRLMDLGTNSAPIDRYGMTLLHKAAIGGAVEATNWLLNQGFDPSVGDIVGDTPLHSAASIGRVQIVTCLLDHDLLPDARNHDEATPLHHAASAGHTDIVELLLERGADAAATDVLGRTPLHLAASRGQTDVVESLLQIKGSEAVPDVNGHQPVELAAFYGRITAWEALASGRIEALNQLTPATVKDLVGKSVSRGEMMAWYLGHSGWAIRTQHHLFILDYAPGGPERDDASLINGRIDPFEWDDLSVYVLTTHHHGDHFDRRILEWDHPTLHRIYGWDAPKELQGFRFTGQEFKRIGNVVIASIPATDAGSAFLIEADGVSFYHAGDHAAGQIPPENAFTEGINWLADQFAPIQAAFLPVFGCGLPSPDTLQAGNAFTVENLKPAAALPMHIGWTSHFYRQFERWARESNLEVGLGIADQPGDRFLIRNGTIEQVWI
jgi:ankyrin repeat protein/L-ascorbate metabolism protein UlaG (beta-lactamase superfamily)